MKPHRGGENLSLNEKCACWLEISLRQLRLLFARSQNRKIVIHCVFVCVCSCDGWIIKRFLCLLHRKAVERAHSALKDGRKSFKFFVQIWLQMCGDSQSTLCLIISARVHKSSMFYRFMTFLVIKSTYNNVDPIRITWIWLVKRDLTRSIVLYWSWC